MPNSIRHLLIRKEADIRQHNDVFKLQIKTSYNLQYFENVFLCNRFWRFNTAHPTDKNSANSLQSAVSNFHRAIHSGALNESRYNPRIQIGLRKRIALRPEWNCNTKLHTV